MAETKIEWADYTFNPWVGCSKVSPACTHCYAEAWAKRSGMVKWGNDAERRRTSETYWRQPLKWNREAEKAGERRRVFCASLADVFEDRPELAPWRADLLKLIYDTPHLDWLLLTKRPENWRDAIDAACEYAHGDTWQSLWTQGEAPNNVWIGTTVENQEYADKRIPELLKIPARVRFLSVEPLLGRVIIEDYLPRYGCGRRCHHSNNKADLCGEGGIIEFSAIGWVIVGGESGPHARPSHPDWFRSLRNQCQAAGVPFFLKQWGEFVEVDADRPTQQVDWNDMPLYPVTDKSILISHDGEVITRKDRPREEIAYRWMERVGKKAAGRLLDGVEYSAFPEAA